MSYHQRTSGFGDLAKFVRDQDKIARAANDAAPRILAYRTQRKLKAVIRRMGQTWRVWAAPGFEKAIHVKRMGPGWWRVYSKAVYVKGRTQPVDLLWVFDQAPQVISGFGKGGLAVPIPGHTPVAASGRRYAWPSELARRGWELEFAAIQGSANKLVLGRANRHDAWRPLYIWVAHPIQMPKVFDLQALYDEMAPTLETTWADLIDGRVSTSSLKIAA
jgi:hypothetical protein